jgi:hypothetical protein
LSEKPGFTEETRFPSDQSGAGPLFI